MAAKKPLPPTSSASPKANASGATPARGRAQAAKEPAAKKKPATKKAIPSTTASSATTSSPKTTKSTGSKAGSSAAKAAPERTSDDGDDEPSESFEEERQDDDDEFGDGIDSGEGDAIVTSGEGQDDDEYDAAGSDAGDDASAEPSDDDLDDDDFGQRPPRAARGLVPVGRKESLSRLDPLETYMREIRQHSLLTPDEEKELAVLYSTTQDVNAAARLVTSNLRLVVKIAYEYRRAYRNMMDLIQEGNMGLMQAVKKYDPYRGVKLSSYAAWWIRAYMLRFILSNWRMVKLGTTQAQRKLFFNLNKERARLTAMGIEPTNALIADRLDVTEAEVDEMDKRLSRGDASLDTPMNESDGRQIARVELLPAPGITPELVNEGAELSHLIRQNLDEFRTTLGGKDLVIFDQRIAADEPRTLQDLGDEFGVSRERVRQLEARLTGKLRTFLTERLGDAVEIA